MKKTRTPSLILHKSKFGELRVRLGECPLGLASASR